MAEREPTTRDLHKAMLLEELDADPRTRARLHEIVAEKYPDHADEIPTIAARKLVQPDLDALKKEREEWNKERREERQRKNREELHGQFKALGVRPDEYADVEAFMVKRNTADAELAVQGYRKEHEVAAPTPRPGNYGRGTLPNDKRSGSFFQGINGGPSIGEDWQGWRSDRIAQDMADMAAGRPLQPIEG